MVAVAVRESNERFAEFCPALILLRCVMTLWDFALCHKHLCFFEISSSHFPADIFLLMFARRSMLNVRDGVAPAHLLSFSTPLRPPFSLHQWRQGCQGVGQQFFQPARAEARIDRVENRGVAALQKGIE